MLLVGCGQTGSSVNGKGEGEVSKDGNNAEGSTTEEKEKEQTAGEILEKSTEIMNNMSSYSMEFEINQEINSATEGMMLSASTMEVEVTQNPFSLYQLTSTVLEDDTGASEEVDIEIYIANDGAYYYDAFEENWLRIPREYALQMDGFKDMQGKMFDEISMLKAYSEDFVLTEENGSYVLTFESEGEKATELIKLVNGITNSNLPDEEVTVNQFHYQIHIEKESFHLVKMDIFMDMEMDSDGGVVTVVQEVISNYSNFNDVDEIVVPQEIVDAATEISLPDTEESDEE